MYMYACSLYLHKSLTISIILHELIILIALADTQRNRELII